MFDVFIVSAASQILPDTLQAWHETSKSLMKNQTSMSLKISELQQSLQELWKNFSEYRSSQEAQKSYEKEEKIVADFGAKIEAIATDVESMKEHYNSVNEKQTDLQHVFENLKVNEIILNLCDLDLNNLDFKTCFLTCF